MRCVQIPEHAGRRDTRREILWEAKRAENWSETWLQKRKADHIQLLPRPVIGTRPLIRSSVAGGGVEDNDRIVTLARWNLFRALLRIQHLGLGAGVNFLTCPQEALRRR